MTNSDQKDFEQAVARLEEIVFKLENDQQLPLEEMIALYKEGLQLAEFSQKRLTEAQLEIERISKEELAVAEAMETFVPPSAEGEAGVEGVAGAEDQAGDEAASEGEPGGEAASEGEDADTLDRDIEAETADLGATSDPGAASDAAEPSDEEGSTEEPDSKEGEDPDWSAPEIPF